MNYEDQVTKQYLEDAIASAGPRIAVGRSIGNGSEQTISVGFTPKAVLIVEGGVIFSSSAVLAVEGFPATINYGGLSHIVVETVDGGFHVVTHPYDPRINSNTGPYTYFAIG